MAASFLTVAIICIFLCGLDEKTVTEAFINGASSLVGVSLIIGLARGVNLIMENRPDFLTRFCTGLPTQLPVSLARCSSS